MTLTITHPYVSSIAETTPSGGPNGTVGPTEWNANHTVSGTLSSTAIDTLPGSSGQLLFNNSNAVAAVSGSNWDGSQVLSLSNGSSPAAFRLYNTVDSVSSPSTYERVSLNWSTVPNAAILATEKGGTGSLRNVGIVGNNIVGIGGSLSVASASIYVNFANITEAVSGTYTNTTLALDSNTGGFYGANGKGLIWSANPTLSSFDKDTGVHRSAPAVVEINSGIAGTGPGHLRLCGTTVSGLSTSHLAGTIAYVTDGVSGAAWGGTVAGSSSTSYIVWWNGSNWTVMGK